MNSKPPKRRLVSKTNLTSTPATVELFSDTESELPPPKKTRRSTKGKAKIVKTEDKADIDCSLKISPRKSVHEVIHLTEAPEYWTVPRDASSSVTYVLDLSDTPECLFKNDKELTLDRFIRQECQDSLYGSAGSKERAVHVPLLNPPHGVECRRAILYCNGCYVCSEFNPDILSDFERWGYGDQTQEDLFLHPIMEANDREGSSIYTQAASFYRSVTSSFCSVKINDFPCGGHAVLREYRNGPVNGSKCFIGCSNWDKSHSANDIHHRFRQVPSHISVTVLRRMFRGERVFEVDGIHDEEAELSAACAQIVHPRHLPTNKTCKYSHFVDGEMKVGTFQQHRCAARLTIFIPLDLDDLRAVVVPEPVCYHNHPTFPCVKVPYAVKKKYKECIEAYGSTGALTLRIDTSSSTRAILNGKLPQELHPSLVNNRTRRELVYEAKTIQNPLGNGIAGVLHQFNQEKQCAVDARYIHSVNTLADDTHVIITMNPLLAAMVHDARWIMVDTTFKVVHGRTNEWKLVIWLGEQNKRVVAGRVWANSATRLAFQLVWNGIFDAIVQITRLPLTFKLFRKASKLLGVIGDAEGAQAQALGDVMISRQMNNPAISNIYQTDSDTLLKHIWKTCYIHYDRGIHGIEAYITADERDYLKRFPYLQTDIEIRNFYTFCDSTQNKKIQDWWRHKKSYPWLLPSLNKKLSLMRDDYWDVIPSDTNPIEGSHAQDNQVNDTKHSLLDAILLTKKYDDNAARLIQASLKSGILPKQNNTLQDRFKAQAGRQESSRRRRAEDHKIATEIDCLSTELNTLKTKTKETKEKLRTLKNSSPRKVSRPLDIIETTLIPAGSPSNPLIIDDAEDIPSGPSTHTPSKRRVLASAISTNCLETPTKSQHKNLMNQLDINFDDTPRKWDWDRIDTVLGHLGSEPIELPDDVLGLSP